MCCFTHAGFLNEYLSEEGGGGILEGGGGDGNADSSMMAESEEVVSQDEESSLDDRSYVSILQTCFSIILNTLAASNPK